MTAAILRSLGIVALFVGPISAEKRFDASQLREARELYQIRSDEEVKAELTWARSHKADFSTPENSYKAMKKAVLLGDKAAFLRCLTPEFIARKYPDATHNRIKHLESAKYYFLEIESAYHSFEERTMRLIVLYYIKGREKPQRMYYQLKNQKGKWLFDSL